MANWNRSNQWLEIPAYNMPDAFYCDCGKRLKDGEHQQEIICEVCSNKDCQHDIKYVNPEDVGLTGEYEVAACSECRQNRIEKLTTLNNELNKTLNMVTNFLRNGEQNE